MVLEVHIRTETNVDIKLHGLSRLLSLCGIVLITRIIYHDTQQAFHRLDIADLF